MHVAWLAALLSGLVFLPSTAIAEEDPGLPPAVAPPSSDRSPTTPPRRAVAITINPLAPLVGRWGANLEVSPLPHHDFVVSLAYVNSDSCCVDQASAPQVGSSGTAAPPTLDHPVGAVVELGYRYRTSETGPFGLFLGPSLVLGALDQSREYALVGGALDVGGHLHAGGFVAGVGVGVQIVTASRSFDQTHDIRTNALGIPGVYPRVLADIG